MRQEICGPLDRFQEVTGRRPTLFRPPYGNYNDSVRRIAKECGYHAVVNWTVDVKNGSAALQEPTLLPGDIILLHWNAGLRADLDAVLPMIVEQGFTIGRLDDYLSPGV